MEEMIEEITNNIEKFLKREKFKRRYGESDRDYCNIASEKKIEYERKIEKKMRQILQKNFEISEVKYFKAEYEKCYNDYVKKINNAIIDYVTYEIRIPSPMENEVRQGAIENFIYDLKKEYPIEESLIHNNGILVSLSEESGLHRSYDSFYIKVFTIRLK